MYIVITDFDCFCLTVYRHPAKYTFGFYCTQGGLLLGEDRHRFFAKCWNTLYSKRFRRSEEDVVVQTPHI